MVEYKERQVDLFLFLFTRIARLLFLLLIIEYSVKNFYFLSGELVGEVDIEKSYKK